MPDPCAHVGFAFVAARLLDSFFPSPARLSETVAIDLLIAAAANLPDLVDKPLFLAGFSPGTRSYGHTLLFVAAVTCTVGALACAQPQILALLGVTNEFETPFAFSYAVSRVVFAAVASHLAADALFGYVPILWPIPGWDFRSTSLTFASAHDRVVCKRKKRILDLAAIVYVSLATALPQHAGGWTRYLVLLAIVLAGVQSAVWWMKRVVRKLKFQNV
eukprot:INCI15125.1.p1 GENE.INCI15125.1~~INCI15125.1.p1  ORF type:complete len:218 (+),score=28.02 INCI15125.1:140-793(+)